MGRQGHSGREGHWHLHCFLVIRFWIVPPRLKKLIDLELQWNAYPQRRLLAIM